MKLRVVTAMSVMAAATSYAHAQSNVTLYGLLDTGVEHVTNVGASGSGLTRLPLLTGSVPSRLGFRGSEDLGMVFKTPCSPRWRECWRSRTIRS